LWYRSSEGCPDGADFLERVGDRASLVRLADAGDRVDFVVNIALTDAGARGRLERETARGTVAIREVEDHSCDRVADVLALNLALALDPDRPAPGTQATPPPEPGGESSPTPPAGSANPPENPPSSPPSPAPRPAAPAPVSAPSAPLAQSTDESGDTEQPTHWRLGVQGGVLAGVSQDLMLRGAAFVQLERVVAALPDGTLRVTALGALGSSDTRIGVVHESLWGARLDACPFGVGGRGLSVAPCGAGEFGQLRASRRYQASARWAALGVLLRGQWILGGGVAAETEVAGVFPLSRYAVSAGTTVLYRAEPVGFSAVVGASVAF
jgi:hypothetical protein